MAGGIYKALAKAALVCGLVVASLPPAQAQRARPKAARPAATTAAAGTFLTLSDIHLGLGSPLRCLRGGDETSAALWTAAQASAKALVRSAKPAFAIYLGDLPSHCDGQSAAEFRATLDGLANIAGTGTKLIYLPGNNDSLNRDYGAFTFNGQTPLNSSKAWNGKAVLNAQPGDMIDDSHLGTGFFAVYARQKTASAPALRVIALNTNIFTTTYDGRNGAPDPNGVSQYQADTNTQLEWLNAQLKDVRAKGEKAIVAMHVPPGIDGYGGDDGSVVTMWNRALSYTGTDPDLTNGWVQRVFLQIVATYGPEIVGLLSSHTHLNEIRRLRDCSQKLPNLGTFTELDLAIPSITTDHGTNPSLKLVAYNSQFEWTENTTYYASNSMGNGWSNTLSFDRQNYPCKKCAPGDTLKDRIAALDDKTVIGTSDDLANLMLPWLRVNNRAPTDPRSYKLSLDATCEVPD
jgi:sphingomyelin phosphodiesterase acid-like 3